MDEQGRIEELEQKVEALQQEIEGGEATSGRRDFMKALGLGGLAVGAGSGAGYAARGAVEPASAQSTGDNIGDVGTPSNPVDVFGAGISASRQYSMEAEPFTLYVRSTGSDSNSGTSASDALATIEEAVRRIPRIGVYGGPSGTVSPVETNDPSVKIDLEAGATYNVSTVKIQQPWAGLIEFDGDATTQPTISVADTEYGIAVLGSRVRFNNVSFNTQAGTPETHVIGTQSHLDFNGCTFTGAASRRIHALYQSQVMVDADTTVTGTGTTGGDGIKLHSSSQLRFDGTVQDLNVGLFIDRGSTFDAIACTIDNCSTGIDAGDAAAGKIRDNVSTGTTSAVTNCSTGIKTYYSSFVNVGPNVDFTGTTDRYSVLTGAAINDHNSVMRPTGTFVRANLSADLTVSGTGTTKFPWGSVATDTTNSFSSGTFTAPHAGRYLIRATGQFLNSASGDLLSIEVHQNGGATFDRDYRAGGSSEVVQAVFERDLAEGDTIEIYATTNSSGDTINAVNSKTQLTISWQGV